MSGAARLPEAALGAQYFARYAEAETAFAEAIDDSYLAALVVPARAEASDLLHGFELALERAPGRVLVILVVNATDADLPATHAANERLLAQLEQRFPSFRKLEHGTLGLGAGLGRAPNYDLLWLDRASIGRRMAPRSGVGTARKVGNDLAVALWTRGRIACPRIASSDADARLPADYFAVLAGCERDRAQRASAWLWPFVHELGEDTAIYDATVLYEISLRYYVLGLAAAGSSYAYHSVGSTLCIDASAYLSVRGFPKREAGEDFYVLDKLAKVRPLYRVTAEPIRIRSRRSNRVPFGTGRRSQEIAEDAQTGAPFTLYSPRLFEALASVICGLDEFAQRAELSAFQREIAQRVPDLAEPISEVLEGAGVFSALLSAAQNAPPGRVLRRRVHTFFDALRTLRFVHGLRDRCLPAVPWRDALAAAPFLRDPFAAGGEPEAVCRSLVKLEAALPDEVGPSLF